MTSASSLLVVHSATTADRHPPSHSPSQVEAAIDQSLADLGLAYLDLYHMHWPVAQSPTTGANTISYIPTWHAMEKLLLSGKTRHIGVSNFAPAQLEALIANSTHKPAVHQMELHPYLQQNDWLAFHAQQGIHVTAYSPLAGTNPTYGDAKGPTPLLQNEKLAAIGVKRNCTVAQVALAWGMARRVSVIPKSAHAARIDENFASLECELEMDDYATLAHLGEKPFRYNNPSKGWGVSLYKGLEGV